MIKHFSLLLFLLPLRVVGQEIQSVQAKIQHATVFLNQAQLTSTAKTTIESGTTQLVFKGLSSEIDAKSIQVSGKGDAILMGVKHSINYQETQRKSATVLRMEDSLRIYKSRKERAVYLKDVLHKEQQMLLSNQAIGGQQTGISVEKLKQMADFFRTRLTEINEQLLLTEQILQHSSERMDRVTEQLVAVTNQESHSTSEITVIVSAKNRTTLELELNYLVSNAGWYPLYDLRGKDTKSSLQLACKANVYQLTGVDWHNIHLTLSTANPSLGGSKPKLNPQFATIYRSELEVVAEKGRILADDFNAAPNQSADKMEEELLAEAEEFVKSTTDFTQVVDNSIAVAFDIALPYSIPSTKEYQLVDVQTCELPATFQYYAVPKLDTDAFLTAHVTGWEKYNLLSGYVNVYFQGTFVGESTLDIRHTLDTLVFSLGRDKRIVVKRERINDYSSRKLIGSNVKETISYRISVRNSKSEPIQLVLEDQVPVSKDSQVEMELVEANNATFTQESGKITWKFPLDAQQSKEMNLIYSAKHPKNRQVNGIL
jgi:uncharacterized protein (TIGR02231 family)